jgi:ABC-type lipoprotein release transport system permease subunit
MSTLRIISDSLRFHWRIHAAVALGVAAATAVLTGALLVGDSVRGSLRDLVLDRLGKIDQMLVTDRFFRQELATELQEELRPSQAIVAPAILFPAATVETASSDNKRLASGVVVLGSEADFWQLSPPGRAPPKAAAEGEIIVNAPLAAELGLQVGDQVVVRFGKADQIPADSPLGRRTDRIASLAELKVTRIIPAEGLGRFSLQPSQLAPKNAYVSLAPVQEALDAAGKINTILAGNLPEANEEPADVPPLADSLTPRLEDYGLKLKHVKLTFGEGAAQETVFDYFSLSSERLLIDEAPQQIALAAFAADQPQPVLTYLANRIAKVDPAAEIAAFANNTPYGIPYSMITAIDPAPGGPLIDAEGQPLPKLADDEIVLTSWAAEDQGAKVGDRIRVTYFEPETAHGQERETSAEFRVAHIIPLTTPKRGYTRRDPPLYDQRPTAANDPDLTPEVKGITDQASIDDWDSPFPYDRRRVRDQDEIYWDNHRTTPKAYVSLAVGQKLWGSRFGDTTSIRIPARAGMTAESLENQFLAELNKKNERLGLDFIPIKKQGLEAAAGTTPFDGLFLALSMFIIGAALMLVWLLFRLGVEQRASEIGLLLALGWSRAKVRWLWVAEGAIVAAIGAAVGVAGGVVYAWLMLTGLKTWWIGAIATPFLTLHISGQSLAIGFLLGLIACVATIWFSLGRVKRAVVRNLLANEIVPAPRSGRSTKYSVPSTQYSSRGLLIAGALFVIAIGLAIYATTLGGEAQAGAFMSAGAAVLASLLFLVVAQLRRAGGRSSLLGEAALGRLAFRNAGRNTGRSAATIALMGAAVFLIASVSAFRMSPTDQGIGGFDLLAESSAPIYEDLNSPAGRRELLADKAAALDGCNVLAMRLKAGDDASCQNLYKPSQPQILGVTPQMIAHFDRPDLPARFAFSASAAQTPEEKANPWRLLGQSDAKHDTIPMILDQNTAMYSLRLYGGIGQEYDVTFAGGRTIRFRVAGLLANSVLQGNLLIGEADFQRLFPEVSGYRSFLIQCPRGKAEQVSEVLEDRLGDQGFDTVDARTRLSELLAVQNSYISAFQSLGALGLVLGTFGIAAVQLRSIFERRKELALLRATGFARGRLGLLVLLENLLLLVGGLAVGTLAALVALVPQIFLGAAHIPLLDLLAMLGIVLCVGLVTGLIAVRATLRAPLVAALRGE